jgi:hypothetical protein
LNKRVAILQSNYIPWKGYFDLINMVDEFIIFDEVQYTKRDWRNRNCIQTAQGIQWLSIPVVVKGKYTQKISEVQISEPDWQKDHWQTIHHNYSKARYYQEHKDYIENLYKGSTNKLLSDINLSFIKGINHLLDIDTTITSSVNYTSEGSGSEKILSICKAAKATEYLSGPSAKAYINEASFQEAGIKLLWMDYSGYPEYKQIHTPFHHQVSIIDMLFNLGGDTKKYMKSFS